MQPQMFATVGASTGAYYILLDAVSEGCAAHLYIASDISPNSDITCTWVWQRIDVNNDTVAGKVYVSATKTDGLEAYNQTDIENGTGVTLDACLNTKLEKYTYTLANADFNAGDLVHFQLRLNEAARTLWVMVMIIEYTKA